MEEKIMIANKISWVGYVDKRKVPFHRLVLEKGTTYNSYLIEAEQPTLIDTVDIMFGKNYVDNLSKHTDLSKIKHVVINHVEPDHAGALPALLSKAQDAVIVTTELAANELKLMFKLDKREFLIVRDQDTLDIGGKTLKFFETPFLHTEETMVTYCVEDKILFPCDQFSTHIATEELFNDLALEDITTDFEAYYQLIMHPHRPYVQDMVAKIRKLDIKMIAPSHGYILRKNVEKYIDVYDLMSRPATGKKAVVLYSTMTGSTRKIAELIGENLENKGIASSVADVNKSEKDELKRLVMESDLVFIGSSTRYADMVGSLEALLQELPALDLAGKYAVAFGSYGWSGEAIEVIQNYLEQTKMTVVSTAHFIKNTGMEVQAPIRIKFAPDAVQQENITETSVAIADLVLG